MIEDWRNKWHVGTGLKTNPQFPFGVVQLNSVGNESVYNHPIDPPDNADGFGNEFGFAGLRWAQSAGVGYLPNSRMPDTFLAVSVDTPDKPFKYTGSNGNTDPGCNVHSPYKQPTAARLARSG